MSERLICYTCHRPESVCLCKMLQNIETKIKFVFLMHPKELKKEKNNTGRLTHLCLPNSQIIDGIDFTQDHRVLKILENPENLCFMLYPGEHALNLSDPKSINHSLNFKDKKIVLFLLDGTWATAKKMMRLSLNLQQIPRLMFVPTKKSEFLIKQQPHEYCLSTLETVYELLELFNTNKLDQIKNHQVLLDIFRKMNQMQIEFANDPKRQGYRRKSYKTVDERIVKRERGRRLFYE